MKAELLMIGTELLLGQIHDTNATWLSQTLAEHGIGCFQKTTVGDNRTRIAGALDASLQRCDVILCSGGLGPTEDDVTRESIAELLGRPMAFRPDLYESILNRFTSRKKAPTENNKKQATLPQGAIAIENPNGTAPGLIVEDARGTIICMPGVPHELKAMMTQSVIPYLKNRFHIAGVVESRVLKVCGLGESSVDDRIGDLMNRQENPTIGLLASPEFVRIRITAMANNSEAAQALIAPVAQLVYDRLAEFIMGENDDTLESVVAALLCKKNYSVSITETSTGGIIAQRLMHANPACLAEGRILPRIDHPTSADTALDIAKKQMLRSGSDCALVCLYQPENENALVHFCTPEGSSTGNFAITGKGTHAQVRLAVSILEHMRRQLVNAV